MTSHTGRAEPASPWWDDPPSLLTEQRPPATGDVRCRHLVIGAGIAGSALAASLAAHTDGVVLLEATRSGEGATGRNAGFLLADSECFGLAATRFGESTARALRDLGLATRRRVRSLIRAGHDVGFSPTGSVRLALDAEEQRAFAHTARRRLRGVRLVDPAQVVEAGGLRKVHAALVDDHDGVVNPLRLLAAILSTGEQSGVRRHNDAAVKSIRAGGGGHQVVRTSAATFHADTVTVAASAASPRLLGQPTAEVRPVRAQMLAATIDPAPDWRRPVYAAQGGDYWRQLPGGRVLLGGMRRADLRRENTASVAASPRVQGALDDLLQRLLGAASGADSRSEEQRDGPAIQVTHRWAGTMAFPRDSVPRAGPVPGRPGVHVLTGFVGHGMGWAPGLAHRLAGELTGRGGQVPEVFRPAQAAPG